MDLTTLESVIRLLAIPSDELEDDMQAQLQAKITEVSARAASYCHREFQRQERDWLHDGGGQYLVLPEIPVQSIKEVRYAFAWDWDTGIIYGDSDYALINPKAGIVGFKWACYWPVGAKALRVTYTGGYDPAPAKDQEPPEGYVPIPGDLEGAICQQVVYEWRRRNDVGIRSVSLPDGTINKMDVGEWLEGVKTILNRYRVRPG